MIGHGGRPPKIVDGSIVQGERIGEVTLLVRYEGKFVIVPVTDPQPGTGL